MLLRELIHILERRLHRRDIERRLVRPFEWGEAFLGNGRQAGNPLQRIQEHNRNVLADSDPYFAPLPSEPAHFDFDGFWLRFPSAIETPYPENNTVYGRYFPGGDLAVIVLPQWNGNEQAHIGLCKALQRFGVGALRLSLPYHDRRRPDGLERADYMVGPNIGRTIQAVQQAVQDVRRAADWLVSQGVRRIGPDGNQHRLLRGLAGLRARPASQSWGLQPRFELLRRRGVAGDHHFPHPQDAGREHDPGGASPGLVDPEPDRLRPQAARQYATDADAFGSL